MRCRNRRWILGRVLLTAALLTGSISLWANPSKLSKELKNLPSNAAKVDVIVQFYHPPSTADLAVLTGKGAAVKKQINGDMSLLSVPAAAVKALEGHGNVKYASPDRGLRATLDSARPAVGATIAQRYGWDGTGVTVAVIDSGINADTDLANKIVYSESFVPNDSSVGDAYGHGTHVAGIIASLASDSTCPNCTVQFKGIAPGVRLVNLRVLDASGSGNDSSVIHAIDRAIQLKSSFNIGIINLSLGRGIQESYTDDPLCQAVERAWKAGIVVVVAAGNSGRDNSMGTSGYGTITSPANDPYVITVGAMRDMGTPGTADDLIASYSSKGPTLIDHVVKPDLVAPGNRIISVLARGSRLPASYPDNAIPQSYYKSMSSKSLSADYFSLSGTSMAAPMVSGAAALLLQQDSGSTPDAIKARLMKSASKSFPTVSATIDPDTKAVYTSQYDLFTVGAGYLNVWSALNNSDRVPVTRSALSPIAVRNTLTGKVSIVSGSSVVWGDSLGWTQTDVWGSQVFLSGTSMVWGDTVVWGDSTLLGNTVVWGDSTTCPLNGAFSEGFSVKGDSN